MDKFLDTPVTGETDMLLSCSDVIAVTRSSDTVTIITYNSANTATITHATVDTSLQMRDSLQNAMETALQTSWTDVAFAYVPAQAISGIVIA